MEFVHPVIRYLLKKHDREFSASEENKVFSQKLGKADSRPKLSGNSPRLEDTSLENTISKVGTESDTIFDTRKEQINKEVQVMLSKKRSLQPFLRKAIKF